MEVGMRYTIRNSRIDNITGKRMMNTKSVINKMKKIETQLFPEKYMSNQWGIKSNNNKSNNITQQATTTITKSQSKSVDTTTTDQTSKDKNRTKGKKRNQNRRRNHTRRRNEIAASRQQ